MPRNDPESTSTSTSTTTSTSTSTSPSTTTSAAPPPLRSRPKTQKELPSTSADIYLTNLDAEIFTWERVFRASPKDVYRCREVAGTHIQRARIHGDLDEIQGGIDQYKKCVALAPHDPDTLVALAAAQQTMHRFTEAAHLLEDAAKYGAKPDAVAGIQQELDWNGGRYDPAIAAIHDAAAKHPSMDTLAREALLYHDLGDEDRCDRELEQAEDKIHDVSPVPIAWLDVQRGIHKLGTGKLEDAVVFYREAVARIPTYVMAQEHLAEALHRLGQDEEATKIYEDVVAHSTDPEFMGALAGLYRAHGRAAEADTLRARATARYGELLRKYPEAMYWHASEYFMQEGRDPKRAEDLLTKNLAIRPSSPSYVSLARAELANEKTEDARKAIDAALAMPLKSGELFWTAARVYAKAGEKDKSDGFVKQALEFNPTIKDVEPPLP